MSILVKKMKSILVSAVAAAALSGCGKPDVSACWSPDTEDSVRSLVTEAFVDQVGVIAQTSGQAFDDKLKQAVENNLKVNFDYDHAVDINKAGALTCAATVKLTYSSPNKKPIEQTINNQVYNVYPADKSPVYSLTDVMQISNAATKINEELDK
jgi:hypothetical protein